MPIQAYVDESGGKGQGRFFVLAGWLASAESWATFSDAWQAILQERPSLPGFKMREAARCLGDFERFTRSERDQKVRKLAKVIADHATAALHCTVDLAGFARTFARQGKPFRDPYFWPFHVTTLALCVDIHARGHVKERFEIIFDEQMVFGPRAKAFYPTIRALAVVCLAPEAAILPMEPVFRSDDNCLPLQAADMLVWILRRNAECGFPAEPQQRDFSWLVQDELSRVPMSAESQWLTAQRMQRVVSRTERQYEKLSRLSASELKLLLDDSAALVRYVADEKGEPIK